MIPDRFDIETAYTISIFIALLSTFVSALELARVPALYIDFVFPNVSMKRKNANWLLLHVLQAFLAVVTLLCYVFLNYLLFQVAWVLLAGVTLYSYTLRKAGKDGSDQVRLLSLLGYSLCFLLDRKSGQMLSIFFSGAQVLIGYTTSGVLKLASPHWRQGNVLAGILSTYSFGVPGFATFLGERPLLEKLCSHGAIAAMLAVPVCFLIPAHEPLLISLAVIFSFHFATAILMGLNDFLITFPLAYPGIISLHLFLFGQ